MVILLLTMTMLAAGCTAPSVTVSSWGNFSTFAAPVLPGASNAPVAPPVPTRCPAGNTSRFIDLDPVPDHNFGDIITFSGNTNLPAEEKFTLYIFPASFHSCQKTIYPCQNPDTVNHVCCLGGFNRTVAVVSGRCCINTWSFTINTSEYDFRPERYVVSVTSGNTTGEGFFTVREKPGPSDPGIAVDPIPVSCLGDEITIHGTTNLPAGENITTWVSKSRYKCTKCQQKNDSVDGCCGDRIPVIVPVKPGTGGINTWLREVNTSRYDFTSGDYSIDAGEPSRGIWTSGGFTVREKPEPSRPWIAIDPVAHHYLGDTVTFRGTTNLPSGEMIRLLIYEGVFHTCPKSLETCHDAVPHCCDGHGTSIPVITGTCGINTWSWDVDTSQYGFGPDGEYILSATGRNGAVENTSFFLVSDIPRLNLTLNLPENDTGGLALRFSGQANTGNGPDEKLLLTLSSDSGTMARFIVPVYGNGTGYSWNFTVNKAAVVPYNFLTVNITSATSPAIGIERTFLYTNEPAYYPYNPVSA